jgi:hypothetical protein
LRKPSRLEDAVLAAVERLGGHNIGHSDLEKLKDLPLQKALTA